MCRDRETPMCRITQNRVSKADWGATPDAQQEHSRTQGGRRPSWREQPRALISMDKNKVEKSPVLHSALHHHGKPSQEQLRCHGGAWWGQVCNLLDKIKRGTERRHIIIPPGGLALAGR